jgi:hypothetical protein
MYVYNQERENLAVTTSELSASKSLVDTYIVILKSNTVLESVIRALEVPYTEKQLGDMIKASAMNNTEAFEITVSNTDPVLAQKIANAITEIAPHEIIRVVKAGSVEVIDKAKLPQNPSSPSMGKNVAIGLLSASLLALGSVCCFRRSTRRYGSRKTLKGCSISPCSEHTSDSPAGQREKSQGGSGRVMRARRKAGKNESNEFNRDNIKKLLNNDTPFAVKEAYNSVRTKLMFTTHEEGCPVYAVTSALPSDGKSINAVNLAITFAQLGKKTLIIAETCAGPRCLDTSTAATAEG